MQYCQWLLNFTHASNTALDIQTKLGFILTATLIHKTVGCGEQKTPMLVPDLFPKDLWLSRHYILEDRTLYFQKTLFSKITRFDALGF
jgi:hypothetical protein